MGKGDTGGWERGDGGKGKGGTAVKLEYSHKLHACTRGELGDG